MAAVIHRLVHEAPQPQIHSAGGLLLLAVAVGAVGFQDGAYILFKRKLRRRSECGGHQEEGQGGEELHGALLFNVIPGPDIAAE